jgi:hypothetical protein
MTRCEGEGDNVLLKIVPVEGRVVEGIEVLDCHGSKI